MTDVRIGDRVLYQGRVFFVLGFSPMSIRNATVLLEDRASSRTLTVPLSELEPAAQPEEQQPPAEA